MAIEFDGVDQYVEIGDVAPLNITGSAITLAIWVKNMVNGEHKVIAKWSDSPALFSYLLSITSADKAQMVVNTGANGVAIGTTTIVTGTWFHLGGTYDGTTVRIYVNGVQEGTAGRTGNINSTTAPVRIGAGSGSPITSEEPMDGDLDDARIYDRALSADEILTIYNSRGRDGIALGRVARYLMNEGAPGVAASGAGIIKDSGPNGLDGTPVNSPIWASGQLTFSRKPLLV